MPQLLLRYKNLDVFAYISLEKLNSNKNEEKMNSGSCNKEIHCQQKWPV